MFFETVKSLPIAELLALPFLSKPRAKEKKQQTDVHIFILPHRHFHISATPFRSHTPPPPRVGTGQNLPESPPLPEEEPGQKTDAPTVSLLYI